MVLLVTVVALTLGISAMCSLFEATVFSTSAAALEAARVDPGKRRAAERFLYMKKYVGNPTAAILILNTVANTAGASVAGMLATREVGSWFIPSFSLLLTLGILFVSEILPKTYGAVHWRTLWPRIVWPLAAIQAVLRPLIYVTLRFAGLFVPKQTSPVSSEQEILAMIRLSGRSGALSLGEQELVTSAFGFDDVTAAEVSVPLDDVVWLDRSWELARCQAVAGAARHTRYPLCAGGLDRVVGLIHIKDLVAVDDNASLEALARPITTVPGTAPIPWVLHQMQSSRHHLALVADASDVVVGIVTLESIMAQLVGDVDELEPRTSMVVAEGGGTYVVSAAIPMVVLNQRLGLDIYHPSDTDTLSTLLVSRLGRLLEPGDVVEIQRARAEVLDVVGTQATRIRVTVPPARADTV